MKVENGNAVFDFELPRFALSLVILENAQ